MGRPSRPIRGSVLSRYLREIRAYPVPTREEESRIFDRVTHGAGDAREDLILGNLGFVVRIAREYRNLGLSFEDLLNEGNVGLIRAALRFDPTRGVRFVTYAVWWIRKSILGALADQGSIVRVTRHVRRKTAHPGGSFLGPGPHPVIPVLLDREIGEDGHRRLVDVLVDPRARNPETEVLRRETLRRLRLGMSRLRPSERDVLNGRFGLSGLPIQTLDELGERMGLSRERVRRIEVAAREKLKQFVETPDARA